MWHAQSAVGDRGLDALPRELGARWLQALGPVHLMHGAVVQFCRLPVAAILGLRRADRLQHH